SVEGAAQASDTPGTLILDGLLLEGRIAVGAGDLGRIELRHGTYGAGPDALGAGLAVLAGNERLSLRIDHSVVGAIDLGDAAGTIHVTDSILGEDRVADGNAGMSPIVLHAVSADLIVGR